jgi:uncharacterized protein YggE
MNTNKRRLLYIALSVATAILLLTGSIALASPEATGAQQRTISVSGSAQTALVPDIAYIEIGTFSDKPTVSAAQDDNNALMAQVFTALKAQGIDTVKDVQTENYSISPEYGKDNVTIASYRIDNTVRVKVRNLDKLGDVMGAVGTAGANLISGLSFDVEDKEAAYNQAVVKAIDDAKVRAQTLAKSAGAALGAVVSASENGGYNPPGPIYYSRAADAAGSVPVSQGTMQISANVSVTFELN